MYTDVCMYCMYSDTPDDCNVPRTCMKRYVEWISV